jgi:hypothetical protein
MLEGLLIAESLRSGLNLDDVPLTLHRIDRVRATDVADGQPPMWTLMTFVAEDECAEVIAGRFAESIDGPGWYVDFHSETETFVVFPNRVFRYPRSDGAARAEAAEYARACGVPDSQLDWAQ